MFIRKPAPAPCTGEETRAGLENRAASCYFNSIVQSLAASSLLEETLRIPPPHSAPASDPASDLQYTPLNLDVNASAALKRLAELNSDKDSGAAHVHDEDLPLITTAVSLIRKLQNSKSSDRTISTADLHKVLSRKNPDYDGISQQDAHEALLALVDQLHLEELDYLKKLYPPPPPRPRKQVRQQTATLLNPSGTSKDLHQDSEPEDNTSSESEQDEPAPQQPKKPTPFIDTIFTGQLKSVIVCQSCNNVSVSMEPFVDITLPMIKDKRRKSNLRGFFSRTASTDNSGASSTGAASDMPLQPGPSNSRMGQEEEALDSSDSEDGAPRVIHSAHSKSRRRSSLDPSLLKRKLSMRTHRRGSVNPPSDANASGSSTPADNACIPPPAKPASRFPIDATAPISEPDEEMPFQPASGSRRLTRAEAQYINTLLTEVSPKHLSPLERLRLSHSGLRRRSSPESGPASPDTASDAHPFQNGLYQALKQFTSVEVLEGDSPYQCKECWKRAWREQKLKTLSFQTQERLLPHAPNRTRMENVQQSPAANQPTSKNGLHVVSEDAESSASDLGADADSEDEYDESKPASSATSTKGVQFYDHPLKQPSISLTPPPNFSTASFASPKKPPKSNRYIARKAYKRYLIDTLPPLLVFHLNRFQQSKPGLLAQSIGASMTGTLRKIDDFMSFPAVLDMSPFLAPAGKAPKIGRPVPPTESSTDNTEQEEDPSEADEKEGWRRRIFTGRKRSKTLMPLAQPEADPRLNQSKYRLTALVSHAGNMYSGHYIAYVNVPTKTSEATQKSSAVHDQTTSSQGNGNSSDGIERQWLYCSDEEIRPVQLSEVLKVSAYMLFYERIEPTL